MNMQIKMFFMSEMASAPRRKSFEGGAQKLREKKKRYLEEGASKYLQI